jgi:hypothetical protein
MGAKSGRKDCRNQRPMSLNIELGRKLISDANAKHLHCGENGAERNWSN